MRPILILAAFAARVIHCGPIGAAAIVKLAGNTIISFMLEGLAEGAVLAGQAGKGHTGNAPALGQRR